MTRWWAVVRWTALALLSRGWQKDGGWGRRWGHCDVEFRGSDNMPSDNDACGQYDEATRCHRPPEVGGGEGRGGAVQGHLGVWGCAKKQKETILLKTK
jgi:hypothetical protein